MRSWTADEARLVEASRQAESRRLAERTREEGAASQGRGREAAGDRRRLHAQQKFNRWLGLLVLSLFLVSIFAGWFWFTSERSRRSEKVQLPYQPIH